MGNYRFKLSDMMPKSWFCKLKEFGKSKSQGSLSKTKKKLSATSSSTIKPLSPRQSYYYSLDHSREKLYNSPLNPKTPDTHFPDPPRKSKRKARKRTSVSSPKIVTSISSACGCHNTVNSVWKSENFPGSPISTDSFDHTTDWIDSCNSKNPSSETDIIFHLNNQKSFMKNSDHVDGCKSCNPISELELHPILTRPQKNDELIVQMKKKEEKPAKFEKKTDESLAFLPERKQRSLSRCPEPKTTRKRSNSVSSPGRKLRSSSPRLGSKKIQVNLASRRKSFSQSFAVVKSSFDPQRDFKESMVEMIMENNIRSSKDLEDLLVCYLSLNSNEYHDVIVKVFKQIWFELTDIRL